MMVRYDSLLDVTPPEQVRYCKTQDAMVLLYVACCGLAVSDPPFVYRYLVLIQVLYRYRCTGTVQVPVAGCGSYSYRYGTSTVQSSVHERVVQRRT